MKKVAVTGHTSGIGKGLYDYFVSRGDKVVGFSRSNGYDLNNPQTLELIAAETRDFDIFVNNAIPNLRSFSQTHLLQIMWPFWRDKEGWIINISSVASEFFAGRNEESIYASTKLALDSYSKQLSWQLPRINLLLIRPGRVDTPLIDKIKGRKLRVSDIVDTVDWALSRPGDVHINEITIRVKDPDKYNV